jgi:hypothetical protein
MFTEVDKLKSAHNGTLSERCLAICTALQSARFGRKPGGLPDCRANSK